MKLLFNFICCLVLCSCSIQGLNETLNNQKNTEKEHDELSQINSKEVATEFYNAYGENKTLQIPTNCNDFIASFKSVNDEVYFAQKKINDYNSADTFAIASGLKTCEHYTQNDDFMKEATIEFAIKLYQAERNKNPWVVKAKKSIPDADNILVFASVMIPGYETQRFGGSLSDLIFAFARTNNENMSSFDVNKNRLNVSNINGTSTIYFKETLKDVWLIKAVQAPDGEYVEDITSMGLFLQPLLPTEARLDFQRKIDKMQTGKIPTKVPTKAPTVNNTPKVIRI